METDEFPSKSWHYFTIFPFFSCGRVSVISTELTPYPKIVYSDMVRVLAFCDLSKNLKKIYQSVPCKCQLLLRGSHQQNMVQKNNQSYIEFSQQRNGNSHQLREYPWGRSETKAKAKEVVEQILPFET